MTMDSFNTGTWTVLPFRVSARSERYPLETIRSVCANVRVLFLRKAFSERRPLKTFHYVASELFLILGMVFMFRAIQRVA